MRALSLTCSVGEHSNIVRYGFRKCGLTTWEAEGCDGCLELRHAPLKGCAPEQRQLSMLGLCEARHSRPLQTEKPFIPALASQTGRLALHYVLDPYAEQHKTSAALHELEWCSDAQDAPG